MKLYYEILKLLINKKIRHYDNGKAIVKFCENMGVTYVKLAQILASQNLDNLFSEEDKRTLSNICNNSNQIPFEKVEALLEKEYNTYLSVLFASIDEFPYNSTELSQTHRATLKNGDIVSIKVKKEKVENTIKKDTKNIKKIINKISEHKNFNGKEKILDIYLKWINEETNFENQKENIKAYQKFADNVKGKVKDTKDIKIPELYEEYCTNNIIVTEFINDRTINEMNSKQITDGFSSYIQSIFYALLNDKQIVLNGNAAAKNIYIDKNGNLGFLNMDLLFIIKEEDSKLIKEILLSVFSNNHEKLYNLLNPYVNLDDNTKLIFKEDIKNICEKINSKDKKLNLNEIINDLKKYDFLPPEFVFEITKSFMTLNNINQFSSNLPNIKALLQDQVIEFFVKRSLEDSKGIIGNSIKSAPQFLESIAKYGLVKGITKEFSENENLSKQAKKTYENCKEMLNIFRNTMNKSNEDRPKQKVYYDKKDTNI